MSYQPWKIIHISIDAGLSSLPTYPDYQGVYIVFWWQNIPLGHRHIPTEQLPMPATQLLNIALQTITPTVSSYLDKQGIDILQPKTVNQPALLTVAKKSTKSSINIPLLVKSSISIVIPTRNRTQHLAKCLNSLQQLSQRPHEIIVVDNAPSSNTTQILISQIPNVRYILEPEASASKARNTGILNATGDIVAFIDDDMTAHPDWLMQLQKSFDDPAVMAVTGLVLPGELTTKSQQIFEEHWSFNRGFYQVNFDREFFEKHQHHGVPVWLIGGSGNMAVRRRIFNLIGGFDERLGAGKKAAGCSEDSEFCYRLLAEGFVCRYEPRAVAYHYHRQDMSNLKQQIYSYMRGHVAALLIQYEKYGHWGNLRRVLLTLPRWYLRLFMGALIRGFGGRYQTLFAEIFGCVAGVVFYLAQRRGSALDGFADL
ncbi:glycosyltransferase family 2 protein [Nostoc sp. FACHB-110]|uniref:glycosyltransferase family 2 protein n=1 Tax=Nostoc sp. FACHB-110 TaxID=2692834 RepID=UPI0016872611|nr:glycosyltransferase [Nostoc sp. FACHB-110]MBD2440130.1 glycosyltransferase [Nostoc sp. FACHB-110]